MNGDTIPIDVIDSPLDIPKNWEDIIASSAKQANRHDCSNVNLIVSPYSGTASIPIHSSGDLTPEQERD